MTRAAAPSTLSRGIRAIMLDATTCATNVDTALRTMQDSFAGWPATCPGASPASGPTNPDPPAFIVDKAAKDYEQAVRAYRIAAPAMATLANILARWGNPALDDGQVARRIADIDHNIWCHNCAKHGHNNVKANGRSECRDCADFRRTWGHPRTSNIIDRHSRGIPIRPDFIARELETAHGPKWRKNVPKPATKDLTSATEPSTVLDQFNGT